MRNQSRSSRRNLLQAGVLGILGWSLSDLQRAVAAQSKERKSRADAVLFVNLAGGPSHLDTLDMKPDLSEETRGEFSSVQSALPGLRVCEHLSQIGKAANRFTLLRGISHTTGDHPQGQAYIATGNRPGPALKYPSYGSVVKREIPGNVELPAYVAIPSTEWNAGYLGDAFSPFKTNATPRPGIPFAVRGITMPPGLTAAKVDRRNRLLQDIDEQFRAAHASSPLVEALDTFSRQAHKIITSETTRLAFDVSREPESIRKQFAADELGQSLLLASRLIESGVAFVTVTNAGWDTHLDNFKGHKRLMGPLDGGIPAILSVLDAKGLLERTLVVVMGEFGRTPTINQNRGRDHFPRANWCIMAGAGVRPGQLIGGTDAKGANPDDDTQLSPDDIGASILDALGIDHHKEYLTRTGRPVALIPHGRVIEGLFG